MVRSRASGHKDASNFMYLFVFIILINPQRRTFHLCVLSNKTNGASETPVPRLVDDILLMCREKRTERHHFPHPLNGRMRNILKIIERRDIKLYALSPKKQANQI